MIRFVANILCTAAFLCSPAMAMSDPLTDGNQAEDRGDYAAAFNDYSVLAAQGNPAGEASVARLYLTGRGVVQSCPLALHWYALAAKQGNVQALHNFGIFYENGICMPQNYASAAKMFIFLASKGFPKDEAELGHLYDDGLGVPQDVGLAAKYTTLAANQNDANAQGNLGLLYKTGRGEPKDNVQAYKWLTISINNNSDPGGNSYRASAIVYLTKQRDQLAQQMTPAEIAQAQSMAANWRPGSN